MVRTAFLAAILVASACRDGSAPAAPEHGSAEPPRTAESAHTAKPVLVVTSDAGTQAPVTFSVEQTYDHESIDRFWKTNTEAEIRRRVPLADAIECHSTICKLTLVGNAQDIEASIDQMQGDQALSAIARNVLLTAPAKRSDGKLELRAYATFEHSE